MLLVMNGAASCSIFGIILGGAGAPSRWFGHLLGRNVDVRATELAMSYPKRCCPRQRLPTPKGATSDRDLRHQVGGECFKSSDTRRERPGPMDKLAASITTRRSMMALHEEAHTHAKAASFLSFSSCTGLGRAVSSTALTCPADTRRWQAHDGQVDPTTGSTARNEITLNVPVGEATQLGAVDGTTEQPRQDILYFAYGANMSPSILTLKRRVKPTASSPAEAVAFVNDDAATPAPPLPSRDEHGGGGVCLCFCHRAGFATLASPPGPPQAWEVSPGAHGVLHSISLSEMEQLEKAEGGYKKRMVDVKTYEGQRDRAFCFISDPMQVLPASVPPTERYHSLLCDGAAFHGLDEAYQSWLKTVPTVPSKDAELAPERTNTPCKRALIAGIAASGVSAAAAYLIFTGA